MPVKCIFPGVISLWSDEEIIIAGGILENGKLSKTVFTLYLDDFIWYEKTGRLSKPSFFHNNLWKYKDSSINGINGENDIIKIEFF